MKETAVALGNFDGVSKAHKKLIETLAAAAKDKSLYSVAFIFETHPLRVLRGDTYKVLMTNEKKREILLSLGIDEVIFEPTTKELLGMSPEAFAKDVLRDRFSAKTVAAGFNYTFGRGGAGDAALLKKLGEKYGFEAIIMDDIKDGDETVSSTVLKAALSAGDIIKYNRFSYMPYSIKGEVEHGKSLGHKKLFPTANVTPPDFLYLPKSGVYKTETQVLGKKYKSITNIGVNPTVEQAKKRSETYIPSFSGDIYGETIEVTFLEKIRDEHKFKNTDELKKQLQKDIDSVFNG
ncbi:MAG: bifunctional riboflavin kinase/FAD synthetase [Clostridia bacterium]|nr:bifunctional riboflavin kinase/FAD synthetase [Clostridia bacterium]